MKRNFTHEEVEELILDLGSDDQEVVEFAMSALLMANPRRHLSDMIEALEWGDDIIKQQLCYVFGGIIDDRCIDPLLSLLNDENAETRFAAIDSLQYFPAERVIPHLKNQLNHEDENIRRAVISTLGAFIKHGVIHSHLPLVEIVHNENEMIELRCQALLNLRHLEQEELKPILQSLISIPDASIYSHILLLQEDQGKNKEQKVRRIEQLIQKLITEDDALKQIGIEDRLVAEGSLAAKILLKKIFEKPDNVILRVYARMILDKMGYKSIPAFKSLFERFDQFDDLRQVVLLQDLITLVAQRQYASLEKSLLKLLNRVSVYIEKNNVKDLRTGFSHIKSYIHFALATYGCRDAVDDIKKIMRDGTERQFLPLIEAVQYVGDKDFLIPLINQFQAYRNFKRPVRTVKRAFKAIVKREKVTRNDPIFNNLSDLQKEALSLILQR